MTKERTDIRCQWCRQKLPQATGVGRRRVYCKQSCRQRAYEARHTAGRLGLTEQQLVVDSDALRSVFDQIYIVQTVLEDIDDDLAVSSKPHDVADALRRLREAAKPLRIPAHL